VYLVIRQEVHEKWEGLDLDGWKTEKCHMSTDRGGVEVGGKYVDGIGPIVNGVS